MPDAAEIAKKAMLAKLGAPDLDYEADPPRLPQDGPEPQPKETTMSAEHTDHRQRRAAALNSLFDVGIGERWWMVQHNDNSDHGRVQHFFASQGHELSYVAKIEADLPQGNESHPAPDDLDIRVFKIERVEMGPQDEERTEEMYAVWPEVRALYTDKMTLWDAYNAGWKRALATPTAVPLDDESAPVEPSA